MRVWPQRTRRRLKYCVSSLPLFTGKFNLQQSQVPKSDGKVQSKEALPFVEEGWVRECSDQLHLNKSTDPDEMHP